MKAEAHAVRHKIFLVMPTLDIGGAERQFALLAGSNIAGFEVYLISLFPPRLNIFPTSDNVEYLYSRRSSNNFGLLVQLLCAPVRLSKFVRMQSQNDNVILYSALYYGNFVSWISSFFIRKCILVWGLRATATKNRGLFSSLMVNCCKLISPYIKFVISNSYAGIEAHQEMGFQLSKTFVVHNFIDSEKFSGRDPDDYIELDEGVPVIIGMVSRIIEFKGHDFVLEALKNHKFGEKVRLVIAGDGAFGYVSELQEKAKGVLHCDVEFVGLVKNPEDFYSEIDVFLIASNSGEGFPNSLGEAMAMGLPCLASDVGDSSLILNDKLCTFPAQDGELFLSCLERMLSLSRLERLELGVRNRKQIQAIASKEVFEVRHAKIFREIIAESEV